MTSNGYRELTDEEQAIVSLWYLVNMSVSSYAKLIAKFHTAHRAIYASIIDWQTLNLHASHLKRFSDFINANRKSEFLTTTLQQLAQGEYGIVFYANNLYPSMLKNIFDPPPLLFYQGNLQALTMPQLAIVGSRTPSAHATKIAFDMAQFLAFNGLWVTSGMAQGIDKQAHLGALTQSQPSKQGRTIAVLGNGIRLCYPKEHDSLKQQIIGSGGCVISELLPDMPSNRHNFPRRNRIVAGLSLGTLVIEAALKSGSLITARLTNDQGKQVFAIPSHIDNINAKGCHQLIRDGATLIDHPEQILEDLSVFRSPLAQDNIKQDNIKKAPTVTNAIEPINATTHISQIQVATPTNFINAVDTDRSITNIAPHLLHLLNHLDWVGQDLDSLVIKTQTDIATLTGWLIELELMGQAMQQGGLYMRCRA